MTDPNLNLTDPNNTTSGLGGALIADMDVPLAGGTGVLIPQTDTSSASFTGNYAFGSQVINDFCCEFDFVGQGSVTGGMFAGTGLVSDPFFTLGGNTTNSGSLLPELRFLMPEMLGAIRCSPQIICPIPLTSPLTV